MQKSHHVGPVHRRRHLDFPEVLPVGQLLGASDGCRAAAVFGVEAHFAVVAGEQRGGRSAVAVPDPVKLWESSAVDKRFMAPLWAIKMLD